MPQFCQVDFDYPNETDSHQVLLSIQNLLAAQLGNEGVWAADTIEDIVQTMREAGYEITGLPS
mgnify:CR=1 FL=1|jgi:hypothetical protein